ncbi:MAG TPA: hypothetical protein PK771_05250, partial [Spirochaetota bacterium]|nr:hypothetical protein [Spirochaetota bacterium]
MAKKGLLIFLSIIILQTVLFSAEKIVNLSYEEDFFTAEKKIFLVDQDGKKDYGYYYYTISYSGGGYNYSVYTHQVTDNTKPPYYKRANMNGVLQFAINSKNLLWNGGFTIASLINTLFLIPGAPLLIYGDKLNNSRLTKEEGDIMYYSGIIFLAWGATWGVFAVVFGIMTLINIIIAGAQKYRILKDINGEKVSSLIELK